MSTRTPAPAGPTPLRPPPGPAPAAPATTSPTTAPGPTPRPEAPTGPETPLAARLHVRPWLDPVVDQVGHDPRSAYVEQFWLATLGPSTTWLLRRLVAGLDDAPEGYELDLAVTARSLGLGARPGQNSPFLRALERSRQFSLTRDLGGDVLAVRRRLPPLSRHQVARLPLPLRQAHEDWLAGALAGPGADDQRRRARRLALSLFELDEDRESAERQLHQWHFHPAVAHDAVNWAWDRHRIAAAAARHQHEALDHSGVAVPGDDAA